MACISTSSPHKCVERSTDCDCPICGDYLFDSTRPVVSMQCGHSIHRHCFQEHMRTSYRCPLCSKSCVNMESQFRNHDLALLSQPMPDEYARARADVSCNDCRARSRVPYHWLGLKCAVCRSYNTTQLRLLGMPRQGGETDAEGGQVPVPGAEGTVAGADAPGREMRARGGVREGHWGAALDGLVDGRLEGGDSEGEGPFPSAFSPGVVSLRDLLGIGSDHAADTRRSFELEDDDEEDDDDDEDDDDLLDLFWGRDHLDRGNAVTSAESAGGEDEEEEEEESSEEEEEDCEEDDDDEDEIVLLGHR